MTPLFLPANLVAISPVPGARPSVEFRPYRRPVTIWVPPYAVAKSEKELARPGVAGAITHVSLQFWVPTAAGDAVLTRSSPEVNEAGVFRLRDWAHANGIRAMLCVFNGAVDWDWPLAKDGFAKHPHPFVRALVAAMTRFGLDGVDVDLEGPAEYEPDKPAFIAFLAEFSNAVHAEGKQLSVASFCGKWNAPKQAWWPAMLPLVDGLTSMGYENTGIKASDKGNSYADQVKAAGANASKLQLGVPSDRNAWQGNASTEQLSWIAKSGGAGIGIWDAQLRASSWKTSGLWSIVKEISTPRS